METREALRLGVVKTCTADAAAWLDAAAERASTCAVPELLRLYTEASRRLPHGAYPGAGSGTDRFAQWLIVDAARAVLLLARGTAAEPTAFAEAAVACYDNGDAGEQRSWLRAVDVLPGPQRFLPVVVDACRTNILPNFEAVACENPYPSRHFPELNFNQLVLKALFNDVRLSRVVGLAGRANAELARMATDFAAERRAAGRPVPIDIAMAQTGAAAQGTTV